MFLTPTAPKKSLLLILAVLALAPGLSACGGSSAGVSHARPDTVATGRASNDVPSDFSTHNNDRDNDGDHNDDDAQTLYFGHAAVPADRRAVVALVTRYFTAAAAEDGATACGLLVQFVAESVPEENGRSVESPGKTCAVVMSKLFRLHHRELALKRATLRVTAVRVQDRRALVILDFPSIPEVRELTVRRVGNTWRVLHLLDGILE